MRPPTPVTTSIITIESGSMRRSMLTLKSPAVSHVHAVVVTARSSGLCRAHASMNATSAPANPTNTEAVERIPACRRVIVVPASVISRKPASGARRQTQPPLTTV
jgi:hypothetical protein